MGKYLQETFIGGMNYIDLDTQINYVPKYSNTQESHYRLGINIRNRTGALEAIQTPVDITFNLSTKGNPQGVYGFGNVFVVFYSGKAYYQLPNQTSWRQVPLLQLDESVEFIYAEAVTGPINNFLRQAIAGPTGNPDASAGIINSAGNLFVSGTPAGIICQDGINQPWIITYDSVNNIATARRLGSYNDWSNDVGAAFSREYVPIGTKMKFHPSGILFIVAPNGINIYRSVSGRPCDFMVNIDTNGNKLGTEALGGAQTTSFAVNFENINLIETGDSSTIIVGTDHLVIGMTLDYTATIFGEPQFSKAYALEVGVVNQFSLTQNQGDTLVISSDGVKSFNEVTQLKFKGLNGPFSKAISQLLQYQKQGKRYQIAQRMCCADTFDDYLLFGLNTKFGFLVAVYDSLNGIWVGVDINKSTLGGVKKFAHLLTVDRTYAVCQTAKGKIFSLFANDSNERCNATLFTGAITGQDLFDEVRTDTVKIALENGSIDGTFFVRELVDKQRKTTSNSIQDQKKNVFGKNFGINFPLRFPMTFDNGSGMDNLTFALNQGIRGMKLAYTFVWQGDLKLYGYEVSYTEVSSQQSQKQNTNL